MAVVNTSFKVIGLLYLELRLPYFMGHGAHFKSFSKIDRSPCRPLRLMHGSGSALCFIAIKMPIFYV